MHQDSPSSSAETRTGAIVPVVLPLALDTAYDYAVPVGLELSPGDLVRVPLGPRERLGVVWTRHGPAETIAPDRLRPVLERIDAPPLPALSLSFAEWIASYTLTPLGSVTRMFMPPEAALMPPRPRLAYRMLGAPPERMTAARQRVLEIAADGLARGKSDLASEAAVSPSVIDGLTAAGTLLCEPLPDEPADLPNPAHCHVQLTKEQSAAAQTLRAAVAKQTFSVTLLDGVTGSGKTEVYFEAVAAAIAQGLQALVLLPEIALTAQFIARFTDRFGVPPLVWHSALTQAQRGRTWRQVASGAPQVVVGARSALFLPFRNLGLIVVDEEHDPAFKQEEQAIYHGRDMTVVRAQLGGIPAILSSATPSIESHVNVRQGRYQHVRLTRRFAGATLPDIEAIDMRKAPPQKGYWLSPPLLEAVQSALESSQQALLFLNRRGYAPLTLCRKCGHRIECPSCSAWMVEHRYRQRLQCHHCGYWSPIPEICPACGASDSLVPCGPGVERVAEEVAAAFPEARLALLSSDLTRGLQGVRDIIELIAEGRVDIIVGTQLIAKGHNFPGLSMVGVVDGDLGLGHADPRASERSYQLLHQVTGRAGRGAARGRGLIQTYLPEHPVMQALVSGDRELFLDREIAAREAALMPPFGRLASLIVSARDGPRAQAFARRMGELTPTSQAIQVLGPAEAPLAVVRGRYRFRFLLKAPRSVDLQAFIRAWLGRLPTATGGVRLTVDIDPQSFL